MLSPFEIFTYLLIFQFSMSYIHNDSGAWLLPKVPFFFLIEVGSKGENFHVREGAHHRTAVPRRPENSARRDGAVA